MASMMRKSAAVLLTTGSLLGVFSGAAQASPAEGDILTPADVAAFDCPTGYVCFYTGRDGTGARCQWSAKDNDWWNAPGVCSWADDTPVASVYNHGTDGRFTGVAYYSGANHVNREGCTKQGNAGNLSGDYKVRSHKWITTSCG